MNSPEQFPLPQRGKEEENIKKTSESEDSVFEEEPKTPEEENIKNNLEQERKKFLETNTEKEVSLKKPRSVILANNQDNQVVEIASEKKSVIDFIKKDTEEKLNKNYFKDLGVCPSSSYFSNFYKQVWARDLAHGAGNYFADKNPKILEDSFSSILKYQKSNGMLPARVEAVYEIPRVIPVVKIFTKYLPIDRLVFYVKEKLINNRNEHPIYEGQAGIAAEDTIPATIIAIGEYFMASDKGQEFAKNNFTKLEKAIEFFETKTDQEDGLAKVQKLNPDWADSLYRGGNKLALVNIIEARALRMMAHMAESIDPEKAKIYKEKYKLVKESIITKLYNKEEGFFRTSDEESDKNRLDTVANVFGALYLVDANEAYKIEENLKKRVLRPSGLKNFDPPYPQNKIMPAHKTIGLGGYHNEYVWPWVTCQNIQVKIKIALEHSDEKVREQYKKEAVEDLANMADLFKQAGGAYEIFESTTRKPVNRKWLKKLLYNPPKNLMGNLSAFQSAHSQLKSLGWIE